MEVGKNLTQITSLTSDNLVRLQDIVQTLIASDVYFTKKNKEQVSCTDIGIGKLYISVSADAVEYKFVPSQKLEEQVVGALETKADPMLQRSQQSLQSEFFKVYKDLL